MLPGRRGREEQCLLFRLLHVQQVCGAEVLQLCAGRREVFALLREDHQGWCLLRFVHRFCGGREGRQRAGCVPQLAVQKHVVQGRVQRVRGRTGIAVLQGLLHVRAEERGQEGWQEGWQVRWAARKGGNVVIGF